MPGISKVLVGMEPWSGLLRVPIGYQLYLEFCECQQAKSHSMVFRKCQQDISHILTFVSLSRLRVIV